MNIWHKALQKVRQSNTTRLIGAVVIFTALIAMVGIYSDKQIVDYSTQDTPAAALGINQADFLHAFMRYDTQHYKNIVEHGYVIDNTAFFPLYPLAVRTVAQVINQPNYALFIVSWFFLLLAAAIVFHWVRFELKQRGHKISPWHIMLMIAVFPTSFYLAIGYTESLFVFLTVSALYAYRRQHYFIAAAAIALATACRVQGGALAVFFLLDYLLARDWKQWRKLIPVACSVLGVGGYMLYLWSVYGDPLTFIAVQHNWGRFSGGVLTNLIDSFKPPYLWYLPVMAGMLWSVKKYFGTTWFAYALVYIAIPLVSGRLDSLNRYIIGLPLLFMAFSLWLAQPNNHRLRFAYYLSAAALLTWNIVLFTNGYWVG